MVIINREHGDITKIQVCNYNRLPLNTPLPLSLNLFQGVYWLLLQLPIGSHTLYLFMPIHFFTPRIKSTCQPIYGSLILICPLTLWSFWFCFQSKLSNAGLKGVNINILSIVILGTMLEGDGRCKEHSFFTPATKDNVQLSVPLNMLFPLLEIHRFFSHSISLVPSIHL